MSRVQMDLFGDGDREYDLDFIVNNPIAAKCVKPKWMECKQVESIHAPQLDNVRCFWCGGQLAPVDVEHYRRRVANLWQYVGR